MVMRTISILLPVVLGVVALVIPGLSVVDSSIVTDIRGVLSESTNYCKCRSFRAGNFLRIWPWQAFS